MAVLGRQAILQAIDDGLIAITPFNADHVGPASVDLTLGSTFRVFRKVHEVIEVRDHTDYRECTDKLEIPDGGSHPDHAGGDRAGDHSRAGHARVWSLRLAGGPQPLCSLGTDGAYQCTVHGAGDQQSAGAGNEQLRACSTWRWCRER